MSQQNRTTLKNYFSTGKKPTQEQFADLVDSCLTLADNQLFENSGNLGLGHDQPAATLSVNGNLNVSPNNETAPDHGLFVHGNVGIGTGFSSPTAQLAVNGGVYIGDIADRDPGQFSLRVDGEVRAGGNVTLDNNSHVAADQVRARDNSGLKLSEAGGKGLTVLNRSGAVETDSSLKIADGNSLITDKVKARDATGLRICEDGGKGLSIDDNTADLRADGNLVLADGKRLETDKVQARDNSGLRLFEDGGKGLTIADGSGDVNADGNLTLADNKSLKTDKVQARDNGGLKLSKRDGASAIKIHDNGHVSIGTETAAWSLVNVEGSVVASSHLEGRTLKLHGDVQETALNGSKGGSRTGNWTLDVPDNKVVCGIRFERWRTSSGDKDFYRFALRYR